MTTTDPRARLDEIKARADEYRRCVIDQGEEPYYDGQVIDADLPAMAAALTAVLDLHQRVTKFGFLDTCTVCIEWDEPDNVDSDAATQAAWPCPTVTAITDALGGDRG